MLAIASCILSPAELLDKYASPDTAITDIASLPACTALLTALRCIKISGDDAENFLQGQFSNDLSNIPAEGQQLGSYCNPKGRALCVYRVLRQDDHYLLVVPTDLADAISKRLQLYKMRAKVVIEPIESHTLVGVINLASPTDNDAAKTGWMVDKYRRLLLVENEALEGMVNQLDLPLVGTAGWQLGDILTGTAQVYAATSEAFIPQQINLDLTDGVSFTKGCYPGQEIVARIRYLGKLKQRLIVGKIVLADHSGLEVKPGTPVFTAERGESKVGMVVDSVEFGDNCILSVMVPSSHICEGDINIGETNGPILGRLKMPYEVTTEFVSSK